MPRNPRAYRLAAFAVLLLASFVLVTVYYREGDGGTLHSAQRSLGAQFAPAEQVVQRVAQPFRDAASWWRDTQDARRERDQAQQENARLRQQLADLETDQLTAAELEAELRYVRSAAFPTRAGYSARASEVVARSPALYARKVLLDQGTSNGVAVGDPVVTGVATQQFDGAALVGRVTAVTPTTAEVTLISDPSMAVTATVAGRVGSDGVLKPNPGDATTEVLDFVPKRYSVNAGDLVTTRGFVDPGVGSSYFPPGIGIGVVSYVSQSDTENYKTIQVTPWADLTAFRTALILVHKSGGPA
jgi:rod shape-determining protein MreC